MLLKVLVEHFTVRFHPEAAALERLVARWLPGIIPALRVELARYKPDKADHPHRQGADDQVEVHRLKATLRGWRSRGGTTPSLPVTSNADNVVSLGWALDARQGSLQVGSDVISRL